MASTTIRVKVTGLDSDDKDLPVLALRPELDEKGRLLVTGTEEDVKPFQKLFRRTVDARISIGEDVEQPAAVAAGPDQSSRVAELEKELAEAREACGRAVERNAILEEDVKVLRASVNDTTQGKSAIETAQKAQKADALEHLARGQFTVWHEQAKKKMDAADKANEAAKWGELVRLAQQALLKLGELCPTPKTNGKHAEPAAAEFPRLVP
jgi:regulator of replication initiation timing